MLGVKTPEKVPKRLSGAAWAGASWIGSGRSLIGGARSGGPAGRWTGARDS